MTSPSASEGRRVFNLGFTLQGRDLDDWSLVKTAAWEGRGETTYLWQRGPALARVVVSESSGTGVARERLATEVEQWMHPAPRAERADAVGAFGDAVGEIGVGDAVVWCPDVEGRPGTIAYARGNAVVGVYRADDAPIDVVELAQRIDRLLLAPELAAVSERRLSGREVLAEWTGRPGSRLWVEAWGGEVALEGEAVVFVPDSSDDHGVRVGFERSRF